ncbi:hypothetical protein L528_0628, partial [Bordetella bronchiseptica MBORD849]
HDRGAGRALRLDAAGRSGRRGHPRRGAGRQRPGPQQSAVRGAGRGQLRPAGQRRCVADIAEPRPQQEEHHAQRQGSGGAGAVRQAAARKRCLHREPERRGLGAPGRGLCPCAGNQRSHHLCVDQGLWRAQQVPEPQRHGHPGAGVVGPDGGDRRGVGSADALRGAGGGPAGAAVHGQRHPGGADLPGQDGQGAEDPGVHARLPVVLGGRGAFRCAGPGGFRMRTGNNHERLVPFGTYECVDGHIAIAAVHPDWFASLLDAMGRADLQRDPRFADRGTRMRHAADLAALVSEWTRDKTVAFVEQALVQERGVPAARVRTPLEMLDDPDLHRSGAITDLQTPDGGTVRGMGLPIGFSECHAQFDVPAQALGQANASVYADILGLSDAEIRRLEEKGVI